MGVSRCLCEFCVENREDDARAGGGAGGREELDILVDICLGGRSCKCHIHEGQDDIMPDI
jgi:hypothetical protein